jgi:hypothetical protein
MQLPESIHLLATGEIDTGDLLLDFEPLEYAPFSYIDDEVYRLAREHGAIHIECERSRDLIHEVEYWWEDWIILHVSAPVMQLISSTDTRSIVAAVDEDDEFFIGLTLASPANKHALKPGKIYPLQMSKSLNTAPLGWQIGRETTLTAQPISPQQ